MEHKLATDEIRDKAALYALGALSQIEARAFENHLEEGCEVCRAELAAFEGVVGVLGFGAPPANPPADLRNRLMANIAKEPRAGALPQIDRTQAGRSWAEFAPRVRAERRARRFSVLPWAVAAGVALLAAAGLISLRGTVRSTREELASTREELAQMHVDILHVNEELADARGRESQHLKIISFLEQPGATHIFLAAQPGAPPSRGADVYLRSKEQILLASADMPAAPPGKVYQLWFLAPGPRSAGLIPTDKSGRGFTQVSIPPDIGTLKGMAITLEPEGGSSQPTMPIYVAGKAAGTT
jgi:anti-sigma-K factor RskA